MDARQACASASPWRCPMVGVRVEAAGAGPAGCGVCVRVLRDGGSDRMDGMDGAAEQRTKYSSRYAGATVAQHLRAILGRRAVGARLATVRRVRDRGGINAGHGRRSIGVARRCVARRSAQPDARTRMTAGGRDEREGDVDDGFGGGLLRCALQADLATRPAAGQPVATLISDFRFK